MELTTTRCGTANWPNPMLRCHHKVQRHRNGCHCILQGRRKQLEVPSGLVCVALWVFRINVSPLAKPTTEGACVGLCSCSESIGFGGSLCHWPCPPPESSTPLFPLSLCPVPHPPHFPLPWNASPLPSGGTHHLAFLSAGLFWCHCHSPLLLGVFRQWKSALRHFYDTHCQW